MLAAIGKWFITSKIGLSIILAVGIVASAAITYHVISKRAYERGVADERGRNIAAVAAANVKQAAENERKNRESSEIANEADKKGQAAANDVDTKTNQTKEVIRYVYHDAPRTKPVAPGSFVHPVDRRVQDRIDAAVDQANDP